MSGFESFGKLLILAGIFIIISGLLLIFWSKIPLIGKLPGDISIQSGNFKFFFPIVTCLVLSLVITVVANIIIRLISK